MCVDERVFLSPAATRDDGLTLRVFNPVSFSIALLLPFYFFDVSFD